MYGARCPETVDGTVCAHKTRSEDEVGVFFKCMMPVVVVMQTKYKFIINPIKETNSTTEKKEKNNVYH